VMDEVLWDDLCDDEVLCHHSRGETRILQEICSDRCVTRQVVIDRVWVHNDADVSVNVLTENIHTNTSKLFRKKFLSFSRLEYI
jgi:hypothetical protein